MFLQCDHLTKPFSMFRNLPPPPFLQGSIFPYINSRAFFFNLYSLKYLVIRLDRENKKGCNDFGLLFIWDLVNGVA